MPRRRVVAAVLCAAITTASLGGTALAQHHQHDKGKAYTRYTSTWWGCGSYGHCVGMK